MILELWRGQILGEYGELALGSSSFKSIDHEKQVDCAIGETGGGKTVGGKTGRRMIG
jgi:hypothetical protein